MNPYLRVLRRNWRLAGAIGAFLCFTLIHYWAFKPLAARYGAALARVGGIEAVFNPGANRPVLPPRVFSLITDHSISPADALERGSSGALGVVLLEELGRMATRAQLRVTSSEPQPVVQESLLTQVRAHVVLSGSYPRIVTFFDELSSSQSLFLVDRFEITSNEDGATLLEIWLSRIYLKQTEAPR